MKKQKIDYQADDKQKSDFDDDFEQEDLYLYQHNLKYNQKVKVWNLNELKKTNPKSQKHIYNTTK